VVAQHVRMPAVPCRPVRVLGQRPRVRVQCPVWASSVHACTVHARVSSVRCGRPVSGVRCPVSGVSVRAIGVRCPVSGVSVRASGIRVFPRPLCPNRVRSHSAAVRRAATRPGRPESAWSPAVSTTGSSSARVGACRWKLAQAVLGQRRRRPGPGRDRGGVGQRPRSTAWPTRRSRSRARIARQGSRRARRGSPTCGRLRPGRHGHGCRHGPTMPGRLVACSGGLLGATARRACGPTAAQAGSGYDRPGGGSALSWENRGWACQDLNLGPHPDPKINGEQARGSIRAAPGSDQRGAGAR
jgi:hypothetical protein